jgi:hypothetical protein
VRQTTGSLTGSRLVPGPLVPRLVPDWFPLVPCRGLTGSRLRLVPGLPPFRGEPVSLRVGLEHLAMGGWVESSRPLPHPSKSRNVRQSSHLAPLATSKTSGCSSEVDHCNRVQPDRPPRSQSHVVTYGHGAECCGSMGRCFRGETPTIPGVDANQSQRRNRNLGKNPVFRSPSTRLPVRPKALEPRGLLHTSPSSAGGVWRGQRTPGEDPAPGRPVEPPRGQAPFLWPIARPLRGSGRALLPAPTQP